MNHTADEITAQTFPLVRRGYDPDAVRAYLAALADDVGRGPGREGLAPYDRADQVVADAEREARSIIETARLEADEVHRNRWQEAGAAVTRVLEVADGEARQLVEAAEAVAMEIRRTVEEETSALRADATSDAEETHVQARSEAMAVMTEAQVQHHEVMNAVARIRADGERSEVERLARIENAVQQAKADVRAHIDALLAPAREQIEWLRAQEAEATTRLELVHDLVGRSLAATAPAPADDDLSTAALLRVAGDGKDLEGTTDPARSALPPAEPEADSGAPADDETGPVEADADVETDDPDPDPDPDPDAELGPEQEQEPADATEEAPPAGADRPARSA